MIVRNSFAAAFKMKLIFRNLIYSVAEIDYDLL